MIAVVLGPLAETELRRALAVSEGEVAVLWGSPFTVGLYAVLAVVLIVSAVQHLRHRRRDARDASTGAVPVVAESDAEDTSRV